MKTILAILILTLAAGNFARCEFKKSDAGINGASIRAFAYDGANLYAGSNEGVLFVSSNKGESWQKKQIAFPKEMFMSLSYYNGKLFASICFNGLYVSSDGGATWSHPSQLTYDNITSIATNDNMLFAAINMDGVRVSSDGGSTWQEYENELNDVGVQGVAANDNRIFAATTSKGLYVSDDDGKTWKESKQGMPSRFMNCVFAIGEKVFVGSDDGVYISSNNGESWTALNAGLSDLRIIDIDTLGEKICVCSKNKVYIASDDGKSWVQLGNDVPGYVVNKLYNFSGRIFAGSASAGVYSYDGKSDTWMELNQGLNMPQIKSILKKNDKLYAATPAALYSSSDNGTSWGRVRDDGKEICSKLLGKKDDKIFAAGLDNSLKVTTDDGVTWSALSSFPAVKEIDCFAADQSNIFFGTDKGIYRSSDDGATWSLKNEGMGSYRVTSLAVSGDKIFAGTYTDGVYASDNSGDEWTYVADELNDISIRDMAVAGNTLYVLNFEGLSYTTDDGVSWYAADELQGYWLACVETYGKNIILGTNLQGFISSKDEGNTWRGGYIGMNLNVAKIFIAAPYIFAMSDDGLYRTNLTDFDLSGTGEIISQREKTIKAYPNPCDGALRVEIPEEYIGKNLEIYSATGIKVRQITAKSSVVLIDIEDLAPGVYAMLARGETVKIIKK